MTHDVALDKRVFIERPLTLDLNGRTISLFGYAYLSVYLTDSVTVKNGIIKANGTSFAISADYSTNLHFENLEILGGDGLANFGMFFADTTAVITNCKIEAETPLSLSAMDYRYPSEITASNVCLNGDRWTYMVTNHIYPDDFYPWPIYCIFTLDGNIISQEGSDSMILSSSNTYTSGYSDAWKQSYNGG